MADKNNVTDVAIVDMLENLNFIHNKDNELFMTVHEVDEQHFLRVESKDLETGVKQQFSIELGEHLKPIDLQEAKERCKLFAQLSKPCMVVNKRYLNRDGSIYMDLGHESGEIARITRNGYEVGCTNINFQCLSEHQESLVKPRKGNGLIALRGLLWNFTMKDFLAGLNWILYSINSKGPFPILVVQGKQGAGKTLFIKILKDLIDPLKGSMSQVRDESELMISAQSNSLLTFDDISCLQTDISDCLYRLMTGGGLKKTETTSDGDENVLQSCRLIIANEKTNFIIKNDPSDRIVVVNPRFIPDNRRRTEKDIWAEYLKVKPVIIGSLYDTLVTVLQNQNSAVVEELSEESDFANFSCTTNLAARWTHGWLTKAYYLNRNDRSVQKAKSDEIVQSILGFIIRADWWKGTAAELLNELERYVRSQSACSYESLPGSANAMSRKLTREKNLLRRMGVSCNVWGDMHHIYEFGLLYDDEDWHPDDEEHSLLYDVDEDCT